MRRLPAEQVASASPESPTSRAITTKYELEISESRSPHEVLAVFHSSAPFVPFHAGDLINTGTLYSSGIGEVLRVLVVEHILWETDETTLTHKLCVYTEAVENTPGLRMTRA